MLCNCITGSGSPCTRTGSTKTGHNSTYCWQHQSCSKIFSGVRGETKKVTTAKSVVQTKSKIQPVNPLQYKAFYGQSKPARVLLPKASSGRKASPHRPIMPRSAPARY